MTLHTTLYNYVKILTKEMWYRIVIAIAIVECDFHKLIANMTPMWELHNAALFSRWLHSTLENGHLKFVIMKENQ